MAYKSKSAFTERGPVVSYDELVPHILGKRKLIRVRHTMPANMDFDPEVVYGYAGGWTTGVETNQSMADRLAAGNRHVVTMDHHRRIPMKIGAQAYKTATFSSVLEAITDTMATTVIAKGDSEGGGHVIAHAYEALAQGDKRLKGIVLSNSACLLDKDTPQELVLRAGMDLLTCGRNLQLAQTAFRGLRYIAEGPLTSAREVREMAALNNGHKVAAIAQQGIPIDIQTGSRDGFFPSRLVKANLENCGAHTNVRIVELPTDHVGCALDECVAEATHTSFTEMAERARTIAFASADLAKLLPRPRQEAKSI